MCDGTGWKPIEEEGGRRVVRCDCWRDQVGHKRLADANIPKRYQHCTFGNFTAYNESLERAVAQARRIAEAYPVISSGLFLEGQPGVGKTHLAAAVLKQVIQTTGARGLFYDTRDLLPRHPQHLRSVDPHDRARNSAAGDDRGSARARRSRRREDVRVGRRDDEPHRQHAYNERRLTIFTSNYPDIPDDTEPNSLLFRIGHRMRSRLHEMCEFIEMDGADYRELPANGGVDDLLWRCGRCARRAPRARPGAPGRARSSATARAISSGRGTGGIIDGVSMLNARSLRPHPFCSAICNYCNFNRGLFDAALKARYVDALVSEIERAGSGLQSRGAGAVTCAADTIYFGGGTPSLLEPDEIARIIAACRAAFDVAGDAEITLEANPESVDEARLAGFRAAGVNRLSFGVQSFR